MYDVCVLAPGGGYRTDLSTGSKRRALDRRWWLRHPARRRRAVVRIIDQAGREVTP